ncbi:hypothetical protein BGZ94_002784 [Podila epigama]|nr:hypothetical protein BGZ94_002784 [Podila epigama]
MSQAYANLPIPPTIAIDPGKHPGLSSSPTAPASTNPNGAVNFEEDLYVANHPTVSMPETRPPPTANSKML